MHTNPHLYLISPPTLDADAFAPKLDAVLKASGAAAFQLRLKGVSDAEILAAAEALIPICRRRDCAFILNDRTDLAAECGADGAHLGQSDGSVKDVRERLGKDSIIGVTCHNSRHLAMQAGEQGADYVAFGAFFPTPTKTPTSMADLETLKIWAEISTIPCVAIGGITADNCSSVVQAGADYIAVSSCVWAHPDGPAAGALALKKAIEDSAA